GFGWLTRSPVLASEGGTRSCPMTSSARNGGSQELLTAGYWLQLEFHYWLALEFLLSSDGRDRSGVPRLAVPPRRFSNPRQPGRRRGIRTSRTCRVSRHRNWRAAWPGSTPPAPSPCAT